MACSEDEDGNEMEDEMEEEMEEDCDKEVSYAMDILPIVNAACALSGCHVDGFQNGDYTTFAGLKEKADNGRLKDRVVGKSMPPSNSNGPKSLSDEQIELFKCWIEGGALDN